PQFDSLPLRPAAFIEPMECLAVPIVPNGSEWVYEIKLDGYRALGIKSDRGVTLVSRRNNPFNQRYPLIVEALGDLPEGTVVDGEIVALDESGLPNFSLLQNYRSKASCIHYFVFDLLVYRSRDIAGLPLIERRSILRSAVDFNSGRVRLTDYIEASAIDILHAVHQQGLEGLIGKRKGSRYEPGKRSGAWIKYRVNRGQELVIGGYYTSGPPRRGLLLGVFKGGGVWFLTGA